jgi:hypothetical protein
MILQELLLILRQELLMDFNYYGWLLLLFP